ncbi:MAG TPA: glycosyltransferase family 1 protein, partial [Firmicutes bacterium]|nr:glycosyltransferase family 1 protein [Bacillota bacterium]
MRPPIIGIDAQSLTGKLQTGLGVYSQGIVNVMKRHPEAVDLRLIWPRDKKPFRRTFERLVWEQYYFVNAAYRQEVDLIHSPCFSVPRFTGIPKVVTAHDLIILKNPGLMPPGSRWYFAKWIPYTYKHADHIIAVSKTTRDDLVQILGLNPDKITVIYHGLKPGFRRSTDPDDINRIQYKYHAQGQFFLMVGSFEPRKNIHHAIDAFSRLAKKNKKLKLLLVGNDNPYQAQMRALAKELGVGEQVLFPGYVSDLELATLYSLAVALVFPSAAEGFGLPLLEAMSTGCAIIASDLKVFHEIAGDAAVYVPVGDPTALSEAMAKVLEDSVFRSDLFRRGLSRTLKFDWEHAAEETLRVYLRVLTRRGIKL